MSVHLTFLIAFLETEFNARGCYEKTVTVSSHDQKQTGLSQLLRKPFYLEARRTGVFSFLLRIRSII